MELKDYLLPLLIFGIYLIGIANAVFGIIRQRINLLFFTFEGKTAVFMGVFSLVLLLFVAYPLVVGTLLIRFGPEEYRAIPQENSAAEDFSAGEVAIETTRKESQPSKKELGFQEGGGPKAAPLIQELSTQDWKAYKNELYTFRFPTHLESEEYRAPFTGVPQFSLGQRDVFSITISIGDEVANNDEEVKRILRGGCDDWDCPVAHVTLGANSFWSVELLDSEKRMTTFALREPQTSYPIFIMAIVEDVSYDTAKLVKTIISTLKFKDLSGVMAEREASQEELDACVSLEPEQARDCYTALAYNKNNPVICGRMPGKTSAEQGNRGFCLGFMAIVTADLGICRNQSEQYYQNVCEHAYQSYYLSMDQTLIDSIERTKNQYGGGQLQAR